MIFDARFEIEHRTGQGGMGTVYRARDCRTGRPVAVKVLHAADAEQRARFSREARLLAELNHPGIVGYLAHGVSSEGHPYLVMEWLEGHDLAVHLQRHGRLKVETSLAIARRLAEVLRIAHAKRILHRDLKPSEGATDGTRTKHRSVPTAKCLQPDEETRGTMFGCGVLCRRGDHRDLKPASVLLIGGAVDRAGVLDVVIARPRGRWVGSRVILLWGSALGLAAPGLDAP